MTDFSNLIDWAKRVYPIQNYDTYEEWESDIVDDLNDSGHMPKRTENLFSQLERFWKDNKKEKPKRKEKELSEFEEPELPTKSSPPQLPQPKESELPEPTIEPIETKPRKPIERKKPIKELKPKPKKKLFERIKGLFTRFRRKK